MSHADVVISMDILSELNLEPFRKEDEILGDLLISQRDNEQLKGLIINFLHRLRAAVYELQDIHDVEVLTEMFLQWEYRLLTVYHSVYPEVLLINNQTDKVQHSKTDALIQRIGAEYDISIDTTTIGVNELNSDDLGWDFVTEHAGLVDVENRISFMERVCSHADFCIRNSEFIKARDALNLVCGIVQKCTHLNKRKLYAYSWAMHLKGNVHIIDQEYGRAEIRYSQSIKIKEGIDCPKIHIFQSKINQAIAAFQRAPEIAFKNLSILHDELQKNSSHYFFEYDYEFSQIHSDVCRYLGYWRCLAKDRSIGRKLLAEAYSIALDSDNKSRQLLTLILIGQVGIKTDANKILGLYDSMSILEKRHPSIVACMNQESLARMRVFNKELFEDIANEINEAALA